MKDILIRTIKPEDNKAIEDLIRAVFEELKIPKTGTAYEDESLKRMFEAYNKPRSIYYVAVYKNKILGGAGIAQLENYEGNVCELQKMYFLKEARGKGAGQEIMNLCLLFARETKYDKVYIETMPYMHAAQKLYLRNGFKYIDGPLGNTGHSSCPVHMLKSL